MTAATPPRYASIQKILHWGIALLVIGALGVGAALDWMPNGALKNQAYALHKATGMLILGLMVLRVIVRLVYGAPPLPAGTPTWQRRAAGASHVALYALLVAMPLVGWAGTSAFPAPLPFFGLFEFPPLIGADRDLSGTLFTIHDWMGKAIFAILAIHIVAAVRHATVEKDGVFQRMWFGRGA